MILIQCYYLVSKGTETLKKTQKHNFWPGLSATMDDHEFCTQNMIDKLENGGVIILSPDILNFGVTLKTNGGKNRWPSLFK